MGDLPHSYSGWNLEGIRVYIHDSELNSILPAVRILMPELTRKNYSWLLITGVMI
jgi:hypothetical protein